MRFSDVAKLVENILQIFKQWIAIEKEDPKMETLKYLEV